MTPDANPPTVWSKQKNVIWSTKLPTRSNAQPVVVGDRIYVCSEPFTLVCLNKSDGKILWERSNSYRDVTSDEVLAEVEKELVIANKLKPRLEAVASKIEQLEKASEKTNDKAEIDAFDAVLTKVQKDSRPEQRFFDSGVIAVQEIMTKLEDQGIEITFERAMDFGCGLGRLSKALAAKFEQVVGVDHSANMIEQAEQMVDLPNCEFVHSDGKRLDELGVGKFDFILSLLVLQHAEKSEIPFIVADLLDMLKPGGIAVFQLPDSPRWSVIGLRLKLWEILPRTFHVALRKAAKRGPYMEMNGLKEKRVASIVERYGCQIVKTERTKHAGWNDRWYFIGKNG
ncbi:MAG: methyltransferase domain-containing protein [Chloroflexi bacterium]|nr:methyltransferase domain-containing protein [Chloroflexota bacterium]